MDLIGSRIDSIQYVLGRVNQDGLTIQEAVSERLRFPILRILAELRQPSADALVLWRFINEYFSDAHQHPTVIPIHDLINSKIFSGDARLFDRFMARYQDFFFCYSSSLPLGSDIPKTTEHSLSPSASSSSFSSSSMNNRSQIRSPSKDSSIQSRLLDSLLIDQSQRDYYGFFALSDPIYFTAFQTILRSDDIQQEMWQKSSRRPQY